VIDSVRQQREQQPKKLSVEPIAGYSCDNGKDLVGFMSDIVWLALLRADLFKEQQRRPDKCKQAH
jgi:hypothetical protein